MEAQAQAQAEPQAVERRRHPRFEVMAQVRVKRGRNTYVLEVLDVSESGALVDLGTLARPLWLLVGRRVELHLFPLEPDRELAPIATWARVVRVVAAPGGYRFAVEFEPETPGLREGIARLIALSSPRPPPLPSRR